MSLMLSIIEHAFCSDFWQKPVLAVDRPYALHSHLIVTKAPSLILPPQHKIEKLKSLLGTDEPPMWYEYDG